MKKSLEEVVTDKIYQLINVALARVIKPDITVDAVGQINEEMIFKLKNQCEIEGIILDVDETIRKNMGEIPKCNEEWIDKLKKYFKVIVVSNGVDKDIEKFFEEKGIDYIGFAHKPLKMNFIKACQKMRLQPNKVLVIGDSLFDDIYGGKKNNMWTAHVGQVEDEER